MMMLINKVAVVIALIVACVGGDKDHRQEPKKQFNEKTTLLTEDEGWAGAKFQAN